MLHFHTNLVPLQTFAEKYTYLSSQGIKNRLRTFQAQKRQKFKNSQPRSKFPGSYKKKSVIDRFATSQNVVQEAKFACHCLCKFQHVSRRCQTVKNLFDKPNVWSFSGGGLKISAYGDSSPKCLQNPKKYQENFWWPKNIIKKFPSVTQKDHKNRSILPYSRYIFSSATQKYHLCL